MQPREQQLVRAPRDLRTKRPAVDLTNVRAVPRLVRPSPSRMERYRAWQAGNYAADQALRVLAIGVGGLAAVGLLLAVGVLLWVLAPALALLVLAVVAAVVAGAFSLWPRRAGNCPGVTTHCPPKHHR